MRVIDAQHSYSFEAAAKEAAITLLKDGIVVFPTDTIYGLGGNALDADVVERLFRIKHRSADKAVPVMVHSVNMARSIAVVDHRWDELLAELWPGPYTFVFKKKKIVPSVLTGGRDTVGIRIVDHPLCMHVLKDFEGPITCTSANISEESVPRNVGELIRTFENEKERPDLVIEAGDPPAEHPSTVIDLSTSPPKIVRASPTSKDKLLKLLQLMA